MTAIVVVGITNASISGLWRTVFQDHDQVCSHSHAGQRLFGAGCWEFVCWGLADEWHRPRLSRVVVGLGCHRFGLADPSIADSSERRLEVS